MSRSHRKHPVAGITTSESEKSEKRLANRKLRRRVKVKLTKGEEDVADTLDDVYDPYWGSKDGKMEFDPLLFPSLMRK